MDEIVTDEMVKLATCELFNEMRYENGFPAVQADQFEPQELGRYRNRVRAALLAVAPAIAEREREACAKVADDHVASSYIFAKESEELRELQLYREYMGQAGGAQSVAEAIRNRKG